MKLLLVDGTNILMRCAFGGDIPPAESVPMATGMIKRIAKEVEATHMIVALDCPGVPTWRRAIYPAYKAGRSIDTAPWIRAAESEWAEKGWHVVMEETFEADDIIATLALRSIERAEVIVLTSDSDLLALTCKGIRVVKPVAGGTVKWFTSTTTLLELGVPAGLLADFKAMTGERSDNIPGVPGIGKVRAAHLLEFYGSLDNILATGSSVPTSIGPDHKWACRVAEHRKAALLSRELATLRTDVPVPKVAPTSCEIHHQEPVYA